MRARRTVIRQRPRFLVYAQPSTNPDLLRDNTPFGNQIDVQRIATAQAS